MKQIKRALFTALESKFIRYNKKKSGSKTVENYEERQPRKLRIRNWGQ